MKIRSLLLIAGLGALAVPVWSQPGQPTTLPALAMIRTGQWQLKSRGSPSDNRSICVTDARALLQVKHGNSICNRFVISSNARDTTVHYTCPGSGHGRTTIRVETPRLIQIESQGIANREPFAVEFEGRHVGECRPAGNALFR